MEIKIIEDKDFAVLIDLNIKMYLEVHKGITSYEATKLLMMQISSGRGFTAFGLYDEDKLVGMVTGYENETGGFYFSGIYSTIRKTEWTAKLIEFSFEHIKKRGYKFWEADATNEHISSILEKYGARVKFVRLQKEFE